jgi:uncharacterized delta-60 repeat protein
MKNSLLLFLLLGQFFFLNGQDGILDPSFDFDGIASTDINSSEDVARSVVVQADGKIIAAGYTTDSLNHFCLVRYHTDGAVDSSFGINGIVITRFPPAGSIIYGLALQSNGKIVAGGSATAGFALARYHTDGSLDSSFGNSGTVMTSIQGYPAVAKAIAIQPDGKVVLGGFANNYLIDGSAFVVIRYNADGSLDPTFGNGGIAITDIIPGSGLSAVDQIHALTLQTDGKIVAVGFAANNIALVRYNPDGSLDQSFGSGGIFANSIQGVVEGVAIRNDGKIVAAGFQANGYSDFMLVRFDSSGNPDNSFGTGGVVISPLGPKQDGASALLLQPDQKMLVGGVIFKDSMNQFVLARYNTNGNLDPTFGTNGFVTVQADSASSALTSMAFQPDGRILAAGYGYRNGSSNFTLARFTSGIVAIDEPVHLQSKISIYPNPTTETATIEYVLKVPGDISVEILSSNGQRIGDVLASGYRERGENRESFSLSGLSRGLYFVSISTAEGKRTFKLIKE